MMPTRTEKVAYEEDQGMFLYSTYAFKVDELRAKPAEFNPAGHWRDDASAKVSLRPLGKASKASKA